MLRRSLLPMFLLLGACAAPASSATDADDGEVTATKASRIVGGTPSGASQDGVVYISIGTDGHFCTGTLIAPNLVITARHCVQGVDETAAIECAPFTTMFVASTLKISLGASANGSQPVATGKQIFVDTGDNLCSHDIGLIMLDQDVGGAKMAAVRFDKVGSGEVTSTVGYGDDGSGTPTNGRYQRASLEILFVGPASATYVTKANQSIAYEVHAGEVATGESTCFGDSGGPLFDSKGSIIGMTSRGLDQECNDRPSIYTDTASHAQLIQDAAKTAGHPLAASAPEEADPSSTSAGDTGDTADEADPSATGSKKTKYGSGLVPQPNAGCSVAAGDAGASAPSRGLFFGLIGVALLVMRRRSRSS